MFSIATTLIIKLPKHYYIKENYRPISLMNTNEENRQSHVSRENGPAGPEFIGNAERDKIHSECAISYCSPHYKGLPVTMAELDMILQRKNPDS